MSDWSFVLDARDLTDELIAEAIESRADVRALLERLSQAITPNTGAGRVLLIFARMATADCDWLEGGLRVDVIERDGGVVIETFTDIGGGLKERALPPVVLRCPLSELVQFVASDPRAIAPLTATRPGPDRLHLAADEVAHDDDDEEEDYEAASAILDQLAPPPAPAKPPRPELKQTQIAVVPSPEKAAAPVAHLPTIEAPKVTTAVGLDDLPPVSELKPGEVPPPIEFDDLEPPSSRRPDQKPLARIALKKQATRNVIVEEPHSSKRGDDRSE